jgi:hypothetical protein
MRPFFTDNGAPEGQFKVGEKANRLFLTKATFEYHSSIIETILFGA